MRSGATVKAPAEFRALHDIVADSKGNSYTAESQRGRRAREFTCLGMASWLERQ